MSIERFKFFSMLAMVFTILLAGCVTTPTPIPEPKGEFDIIRVDNTGNPGGLNPVENISEINPRVEVFVGRPQCIKAGRVIRVRVSVDPKFFGWESIDVVQNGVWKTEDPGLWENFNVFYTPHSTTEITVLVDKDLPTAWEGSMTLGSVSCG